MSQVDELSQLFYEAEIQEKIKIEKEIENERMRSTYEQWRFGAGVIMVGIVFLLLSIFLSNTILYSDMFIAVSILCVFIGVYFMDRGIKHPSYTAIINYTFSHKKLKFWVNSSENERKMPDEIDEFQKVELKIVKSPTKKNRDN